jgi:L-fuculose-phosphate aldolase
MKHPLGPVAEELVDACQVLAAHGHEDMTLGHLSWRDPEGHGFWCKRAGIGLSEVRGADDFLLLGFDGVIVAGEGPRHIEWPIHAGVLIRRPDVNAVLHSHPRHSVLCSALDETLPLVGNESVLFIDGVPRFTATADLIRTPELGRQVAETLAEGRVLFLRNHGIVVATGTVADLVLTAIYLERTARNVLDLLATGRAFVTVDPDDARAKQTRTATSEVFAGFWEYYRRKIGRSA